ncbi:hypothetical protein J132_08059 [Termitomyces sp. J132]|nr:hypothetical protein J132_08059 [Termitomyces sp. J132]
MSKQNLTFHSPTALTDLNVLTSHLQVHAIKKSTANGYATGVHDYVKFCINHNLSFDPTPQTLSCYIAYNSKYIGSGLKYLTGLYHFIQDFYPDFDNNQAHPLAQAMIRGLKKVCANPVHQKLLLCPHHLASFVKTALQTKSYDDLLFATMMPCCFYACHRSEELVKKTVKEPTDWQKIIKRSSVNFTPGHARYH